MRTTKKLEIKGIRIEKNELENYMQRVASGHTIKNNSNKNTYPIPDLIENFNFITKTYNLLNDHIKLNINIHPAGEWILDNYYIIEEAVKTIKSELTIKKYKNLIGIENGPYSGFARIYVLASEIIAYTESKIDEETLKLLIKAYQKKKNLSMEEIWNIKTFIQIAIIKNIKHVCERIYLSQIQKYKVESIVERFIEQKDKKNQRFKTTNILDFNNTFNIEMKYPFVEYMSYKLKKYGKRSYKYLKILEEQVEKTGTSISEIIKKEHFDIAIQKVLMANCIISLKEIASIDFVNLFEEINQIEEILKQDPANIYSKMDYKTKIYYRNKIKEISEKTKISENYIAAKLLELANEREKGTRENHIGYFLIDDGIFKLYEKLDYKINRKKTNKARMYIALTILIPLFFATCFTIYFSYLSRNIIIGFLSGILIYIPITEIYIKVQNYILTKIVKPKLIPKLDLSSGIDKEYSTFIVIPTIVKNKEKVKELLRKLEVYYLANKSENLYFAVLGDCSSGNKEDECFDDEIIETAKIELNKLNEKYKNNGFPKFNLIYRKRMWNEKEKCFLGWERKRGLLNQFNEYLTEKKNVFKYNSMEEFAKDIPYIKYIITLDSDTSLTLNSGLELIGAMSHILNRPVIKNGRVIKGYGIMQPRVGIDLNSSRESLFSKIYAGLGGTDLYANAISDVYQDNFNEGIFAGKGIYDLNAFNKVLKNAIPENTVLSHDLLEGNYLRCALISDVMLMDGYPSKYSSYITRLMRWTRGDFQITRWLKNKIIDKEGNIIKNPLNELAKYKILDNLRRAIFPISSLLSLIFFIIISNRINTIPVIVLILVSLVIPLILDLINYIIFKKQVGEEYISAQKNFSHGIKGLMASLIRGILDIANLPHKAYVMSIAIIKTIYRLNISKQNLLEWMTAEEAEKQAKTDLLSYYNMYFINIIFSILAIITIPFTNKLSIKIILTILAVLWIVAPFISWKISAKIKNKDRLKELTNEQKEKLLEIGKRTWNFFDEYINEENNFLPPDNYQQDRNIKIAYRTSPTNIGLGLLSCISAYDLGYIELNTAIERIRKTMETIMKLSKWNGHLYNWYNTKTLEVLTPRYVSTVDSGNFVGYLYIIKQFLIQNSESEDTKDLIQNIEQIIENTNFKELYNSKKRLFSIGFNIEENKLTDSYYDLLASEARQTSLIAIAKKDVEVKHWNNLSRTLTSLNKYKGLISWAGTSFEYLMSNINVKKYTGSLIDESCKFMLMCQKEYTKKLGIPFGITESAFYLKDLYGNYQYKAFGIPWLGLKRGLGDELVVAPYGSILAVSEEPKEVMQNIMWLEKEGAYGKYGFYEAIDYTPSRLKPNEKLAIVKTYMAHHQGLIINSINNFFNNDILQQRFFENPEIESIDILLQERMPENVIITKEKKEKPSKLKNESEGNYIENVITKFNNDLNNLNIISNEEYSVVLNENGEGFSKYKDILINRFKKTADVNQGIFFYIKNIKNKRIWSNAKLNYLSSGDKFITTFAPYSNKLERVDGSIKTKTKITIAQNENIEIRSLSIENNGLNEETLEITSVLEPILSKKEQDYAHPAFNNLFLEFENIDNFIIVKRRARLKEEKDIYLGVSLCTDNESIGELEFEINKEKFNGRCNLNLPQMVKESRPFSKNIGLVVNPIIALKRTMKIMPKERVVLNLLIAISEVKEEVLINLNKYKSTENVIKTFELSKARAEAESRYLDIKGTNIITYQKLLSYLLLQNPMKKMYITKLPEKNYPRSDLWRYGISGDLPILLAKIKDVNDVYVIEELLKAYEFFRIKNVQIDLIILNNEENSYEQYVKEQIETAILNKHLAYLKNIKGGIFVLNTNEIESSDLFEFLADFIIDCKKGNIKEQIEEQEEDYISKIKNIGDEKQPEEPIKEEEVKTSINKEEVEYWNEYGGFLEDGKKYLIKINSKNNLPTVWSNIMANKNFGTIVTENMGGFTWYKNSRLNRLTSWNNNPEQDIPSEIIYFKDIKTGKEWSIGKNPMPDNNEYNITYGFGYSEYSHTSGGIVQNLEMFIPQNENVKINLLKIKNTNPSKRELKLIYYVKPVLNEDEIKSNGYVDIKKEGNILIAKNLVAEELRGTICYISSSEKITSYTGSKNFFIGGKSLENPMALNKIELNNENGLGQNSCIAIEMKIELEAYEDKELSIIIGASEEILDLKNIVYKYSKTQNCKEELRNIKNFWNETLGKVKVKTPERAIDIVLNGWAIYQTISSRIWAKSGYHQSGGATGFRDQLQDTLGLKYINEEYMKNQILNAANHQFIEGDVEHWWHSETKRGIRTRFSDDLLWLPYTVFEYVNTFSDYSILDKNVKYRKGELLNQGEDESYDIHEESDIEENIYMHCKRAIEKAINFGENGLPKIGSGDWNDGFSTVGNKGKGESIWLRIFLI